MTPLETKATDAVLAATAAREIVWTRENGLDVWTARWREVSLRVIKADLDLVVGRRAIDTYDATPLIAEIEQGETRVYRQLLKQLAGGAE